MEEEKYCKWPTAEKKKARCSKGIEGHQVVRIITDGNTRLEYYFGIPYLGEDRERMWALDDHLERRKWLAAIGVSKKVGLTPEEVTECIAFFENSYLKIYDRIVVLAGGRAQCVVDESEFLELVDVKFENTRQAMKRKYRVETIDDLRKALTKMGFVRTG